jgi:hypothetical protein
MTFSPLGFDSHPPLGPRSEHRWVADGMRAALLIGAPSASADTFRRPLIHHPPTFQSNIIHRNLSLPSFLPLITAHSALLPLTSSAARTARRPRQSRSSRTGTIDGISARSGRPESTRPRQPDRLPQNRNSPFHIKVLSAKLPT